MRNQRRRRRARSAWHRTRGCGAVLGRPCRYPPCHFRSWHYGFGNGLWGVKLSNNNPAKIHAGDSGIPALNLHNPVEYTIYTQPICVPQGRSAPTSADVPGHAVAARRRRHVAALLQHQASHGDITDETPKSLSAQYFEVALTSTDVPGNAVASRRRRGAGLLQHQAPGRQVVARVVVHAVSTRPSGSGGAVGCRCSRLCNHA